jgi:hypothetical protein
VVQACGLGLGGYLLASISGFNWTFDVLSFDRDLQIKRRNYDEEAVAVCFYLLDLRLLMPSAERAYTTPGSTYLDAVDDLWGDCQLHLPWGDCR